MLLLSGRVARGGIFLSRIFAYDVFIANWDRHPGNYLVINDGSGALTVFAIDFSHVTVHPGLCEQARDPLQFPNNATRAMFGQIVSPYGFDAASALETVERLRDLPAVAVEAMLTAMPDEWLSIADRQSVAAWWSGPERKIRADLVEQGLKNGTFA